MTTMDASTEHTAAPETATEPDGWEWAIVEVFGHRRHAGRIREEERFGSKLLRVDVPTLSPASGADRNAEVADVTGWTTHWYGGGAIFSLTHTDEATVLRANRPYVPAGRYLPRPGDDLGPDEDDGCPV